MPAWSHKYDDDITLAYYYHVFVYLKQITEYLKAISQHSSKHVYNIHKACEFSKEVLHSYICIHTYVHALYSYSLRR